MRVYLNCKNIQELVGCGRTKAIQIRKAVNEYTTQKGIKLISNRVCLAKHFCEMYGYPIDKI